MFAFVWFRFFQRTTMKEKNSFFGKICDISTSLVIESPNIRKKQRNRTSWMEGQTFIKRSRLSWYSSTSSLKDSNWWIILDLCFVGSVITVNLMKQKGDISWSFICECETVNVQHQRYSDWMLDSQEFAPHCYFEIPQTVIVVHCSMKMFTVHRKHT